MNETITRDPIVAGAPRRRVSWGAIWAGMFVTVIMQLMFLLLGVACGIASLSPFSNVQGLSVGAMIWLIISWLISVWVGSCVAGWMAGGPRRSDGTVHGIVVWSFASAIILLLLTGVVGTLLGASSGVVVVSSTSPNQIASAQGQAFGNALSPTGRPGDQVASNSSSPATRSGAVYQPFWGSALFTFIALALGLAASAWGGSSGVARSDRSFSAGTVTT